MPAGQDTRISLIPSASSCSQYGSDCHTKLALYSLSWTCRGLLACCCVYAFPLQYTVKSQTVLHNPRAVVLRNIWSVLSQAGRLQIEADLIAGKGSESKQGSRNPKQAGMIPSRCVRSQAGLLQSQAGKSKPSQAYVAPHSTSAPTYQCVDGEGAAQTGVPLI